jgi:hypothetical protein
MVVVGHTCRCCDTVEVLGERNHLGCEAVGCKAVAGAQKNLDCKDIEMWIFVLAMEAQDRLAFLLG